MECGMILYIRCEGRPDDGHGEISPFMCFFQ
jgi:hypothetical protein